METPLFKLKTIGEINKSSEIGQELFKKNVRAK